MVEKWIPEQQTCKRCSKYDFFNFIVSDEDWKIIVPDNWQNLNVCLECFDKWAYDKGHIYKIIHFSFAGLMSSFDISLKDYKEPEWLDKPVEAGLNLHLHKDGSIDIHKVYFSDGEPYIDFPNTECIREFTGEQVAHIWAGYLEGKWFKAIIPEIKEERNVN